MAEFVYIRNEFGEEQRVRKAAAERGFFPGYVVLDAAGRKKAKQPAATETTTPATDKDKTNG